MILFKQPLRICWRVGRVILRLQFKTVSGWLGGGEGLVSTSQVLVSIILLAIEGFLGNTGRLFSTGRSIQPKDETC